MKSQTVKILFVLLAVTVAISAAACDTALPEPDVQPTPTPRPSPTPTPTPAPTPTPPPDLGLLQLGEAYYMNGDVRQMDIVFLEGGVFEDGSGEEARYEVDGSVVNIFRDGSIDSGLIMISEFVLEDVSTGIRFIREGGDGFGGVSGIPSGSREIFFEADYFLDGETDGPSLFFYDSGEVALGAAEERELGRYTIDADWIMITVGDELRLVLNIVNAAELVDVGASETYALKGAIGAELMLDERYYQFGEAGEISMRFLEEGEVVFEYMGDVISSGEYTVEDDRISLDLDGVETELAIVNNYVLFLLEQELQFVRLPK